MLIRLSQGQLNLLATCPRKFQQVYLEQLALPIPPDQQERLTWGSRFHLLMQQRELGLPWANNEPNASDRPLLQTVNRFVETAPEVLAAAPFRQSEHRRTLEFQGYLLTVVYDLLVLDAQQAHILDWKTYPRPQRSDWLAQHWQTRLYPFVLAETSDYRPEQIAMTYWFVHAEDDTSRPQSLRFAYHTRGHDQTRQDLTMLLSQLSDWLDRYDTGEPFPQVTESAGHCAACTFALRCQRGPLLSPPLPPLADIEEVAL